MTLLEVLNILWNLYDAAITDDAFDSDQEKIRFREMLTNLKPVDRNDVIELRDRALSDGNMLWSVELSHVVCAMANEKLWQGEEVPLSTV